MSDLFGNYRSSTTRALQSIDSSKYPDTNKNQVANIQRLNQFVDYLAQYMGVMQKGVDKANEDPITQLRNTITDIAILLGGGELLYGINLGDLQYFLPALAAMFGFDSDVPFPINLLLAAEHFFLGYIIPLDSWAFAVEDIIDIWAIAFGLPADFVASLHDLLDAAQSITSDFIPLFNGIANLITIFDISPILNNLTGFDDIWSGVRILFGGSSLSSMASLSDPVFHSLAPWIEVLATLLNDFDSVIKAFTGGLYDLAGILNLANMITNAVNLVPPGAFDPAAAWLTLFQNALTAAAIPVLNSAAMQGLIDVISVAYGGVAGLGFTGLQTFLGGLATAQELIDKLYYTLTQTTGTAHHSATEVAVALITIPANFLFGALSPTALTVAGVTLATLFSNINSAGQLIVSGFVGALTSSGILSLFTSWANIITGLGAFNTSNLLNVLSSWGALLAALGSFSVGNITSALASWANVISALGAFSTAQITTLLASWSGMITALGALTTGNILSLLTSWANIIIGLGAFTAGNITNLFTNWANIISGLGAFNTSNLLTILTSWSALFTALGSFTTGNITSALSSWSNMVTSLGAFTTANITGALTSWSFMLTGLGAMTTANITSLLTSWANMLTSLGGLTAGQITTLLTSWSFMLTGLGSMTTSNITSLLTSWANILTSLGSLSSTQITTLLVSWATILGVGGLGALTTTQITTLLTSWSTIFGVGGLGALTTGNITSALTSWSNMITGLGALTTGNITSALTSWTNLFTALGAFSTTIIGNLLGSWASVITGLGALSSANVTNLITSAFTSAQVTTILSTWSNLLTGLGAFTTGNITSALTSWSFMLTGLGAMTTGNITSLLTSWANMLTSLGALTTGQITTFLTSWSFMLTGLGALTTGNITSALTSWANMVTALGAFTTGQITSLLTSWANMATALGAMTTASITTFLGSWTNLFTSLGAFSTTIIGNLLTSWANMGTALGGMTNANINAILGSWFNSSGNFIGVLNAATSFGGFALSTVLQYLTPSSGLWNAAGIAGALNLSGITAGGTALSTLISGGLLNASQIAGTLTTAILNQIAAAIKNQVNNLGSSIPDTVAGFAAVLNDLAKAVGLPTQLGSGSPVLSGLPNAPGVLGLTQGINDGLALANSGASAFLTQASTDYNSAMTNANIIANQFISAVVPHWF